MKTIHLFFACLIALAARSQTPITLGNTNMPGSGDTLRYTDIQLSSLGNYTQTGVNFTWDFSTVISTTQGLREFKSALFTPYALFFLQPNEYGEKVAASIPAGPITINDYYNFYKKQTNPAAFIADGAGITFSSIPVPSYYSDKDELYNFPMSYPKYDSTTFKFSTPSTTLIPLRYSKAGYRVTRVDGWGTIITPWGSAPCLRLVTTQYAMDTIKTSLGPVQLPPLGFPNYVKSYQWLTTSAKIPMLEVTGNLLNNVFTITTARYRGYPKQVDATGMQEWSANSQIVLLPNPANDKLSIAGLAPNSTVSVYDAQGRCVMAGTLCGEACGLDVEALVPGMYSISVSNSGGTQRFRFIKSGGQR